MTRRWTEADLLAYQTRREGSGTGRSQSTAKQGRPAKAATGKKARPLLDDRPHITHAILVNILGVELERRFPGVFTAAPAPGVQWGNADLRLGVNVCGVAGIAAAGERVFVFTPRQVSDHMSGILDVLAEVLKVALLEETERNALQGPYIGLGTEKGDS